MFDTLKRTYLDLFHEYPVLLRLAIVTGLGQLAFALLNMYALPMYLYGKGVEAGTIGAIATTFLLAEMVLKFPMGKLSDRFGRKPFVVFGPLLVCLNPILYIHVYTRAWAVSLLRIVDGTGAAALWPPLLAMVGDLIRSARRAAAMSIFNAVYAAGGGAAFVVGLVVSRFGNDVAPFYLASILLLIAAAFAHFGLPKVTHVHVDEEDPAAEAGPILASAGVASARHSHIRYPLWLVLSLTFLMSFGVLSLPQFLMLYLKQSMKFSDHTIIVMLVGLAIPVVILGLPLGHAADRWGKELAVRVALITATLAMWLIPFCHTVVCLGLATLLLVISYMTVTPAWLAIISDLAPAKRRGHIMSLVATSEGVGAALGPIMGGLLWGANVKLLNNPWLSWLGLSRIGNGYFLKEHPSHIFLGSAVVLTLCALLAVVMLRAKVQATSPDNA